MYLDIGGGSKVRNVNEPSLEVNLRWTKRGFFTKEEFKVEGEVCRTIGKKQEILYKISGNWNNEVSICKYEGDSPGTWELIWKKHPSCLQYYRMRLLNILSQRNMKN
jgi:hypothetical protein